MKRAVFLDRDGTMLEEGNYVDRLDRLVFFPYTVDAIRALNEANFAVVVVTNQSGVARGMYPESFVAEAHRFIDDRLRAGRARVDAYYYCPHHPEGTIETLGRIASAVSQSPVNSCRRRRISRSICRTRS